MAERSIPDASGSNLDLPEMNDIERKILELYQEISPQTLYRSGFEDLSDKVFIPSKENIDRALERISELEEECGDDERGQLSKKLLLSLGAVLSFDEPHPDLGLVSDVFSTHLIKEGVVLETYKKLTDKLIAALNASLEKLEGKDFPTAIKVLTQYQVIGASEILDIIEYGTKDKELLAKIQELRERVVEFSKRFSVEGFGDGEFEEVIEILRKNGADLERSSFYPKALSEAFDYVETPDELEQKALSWIEEDLPKLKAATQVLSKQFRCAKTVEAVVGKLRSRPNFRPQDALAIVLEIRPIIQALVAESIVGINPRYDAIVVETPPYLTPIFPTGAAGDFDSLTKKPSQRFYITTDPKKAPPSSFSDLVNLLVHEEYGHCVHSSNTSARFAAEPTLSEMLPSLHGGTTSEGLAFQRELEFLDCIRRLAKKVKDGTLTPAEQGFVSLTKRYGGFDQVLREMEFSTYKQRIIRFLRVVGDVRINSGKQDLLSFLQWAEEATGISQRTVYFQIFPAHEAVFPGYATCYAVVGQQIREIQKPISENSEQLVKFNAYACSMGFPARSIYEKRLRKYVSQLLSMKPAPKVEEVSLAEPETTQRAPHPTTSRKLIIPSATTPTKSSVSKRRTIVRARTNHSAPKMIIKSSSSSRPSGSPNRKGTRKVSSRKPHSRARSSKK